MMSFTFESDPTMFDWPAKMNTRRVLSSAISAALNGIATAHKTSRLNNDGIVLEFGRRDIS